MNKISRTFCLIFISCLICFGFALGVVFYADAGISELSVFESENLTGATSLPGSLWYFEKSDNSGTSIANNEITFSPNPNKTSTANSRFNLKRKINDLAYSGVNLNFDLTAKFLLSNMPEGVRFVFAFGMAKVNTYPNEGSTVLYFENKNGTVGFGVATYGTGAAEKAAFTPIAGFSASEYVNVHFTVDAEGGGSGTVNGTAFSASGLPVSGFAGFGQTTTGSGRVTVKLKDIALITYENSTPENTDIFEDFNNNCFNYNVFQTKSRASGLANSRLCVEDKKLRFSNTGSAYMESQYKYSNVDVAFDVVDVQKETTFTQDGQVDVARSCAFGVAFGIEVLGRGMQTKAPLSVSFVPDRSAKTDTLVVLSQGLEKVETVKLPEKYDMFEKDGVFGVKIIVRDGSISVLMKTSEEKGYTTVLEHVLGFTPTGYFQIAAFGAFDSNLQKGLAAEQLLVGSFALDNLSVKNNDAGKLLKLVNYLSSNASLATDYAYYVNEWSNDDLLKSTIK